jgi:hypothetical protein
VGALQGVRVRDGKREGGRALGMTEVGVGATLACIVGVGRASG